MKIEDEIKWFRAGESSCGPRTERLVRALIDERQQLINNLTAKDSLLAAYEEQALEDGHD